jgi:hypothetical protein
LVRISSIHALGPLPRGQLIGLRVGEQPPAEYESEIIRPSHQGNVGLDAPPYKRLDPNKGEALLCVDV